MSLCLVEHISWQKNHTEKNQTQSLSFGRIIKKFENTRVTVKYFMLNLYGGMIKIKDY